MSTSADEAIRIFVPARQTSASSTVEYDAQLLARVLEVERHKFFAMRLQEWLEDTAWESSISRITAHSRFRELVGMGEFALREALRRIARGEVHIHFFPLMKDIALVDPVSVENRGRVQEMAKQWLEWGKSAGKV